MATFQSDLKFYFNQKPFVYHLSATPEMFTEYLMYLMSIKKIPAAVSLQSVGREVKTDKSLNRRNNYIVVYWDKSYKKVNL